MAEILKKEFKEHSHQKISKIKEMQAKYKDDLVQPREGGEINPRYVELYGAKHLNVSSHDVSQMAKKSHRLSQVLDRSRGPIKKYY
jgi:hypothetical protein